MTLRSARNYDTREASRAAAIKSGAKSRTVQSQKESADINVIVKRFGITGELPVHKRVPLMYDIDRLVDYRECVEYVQNGERAFASMPSRVRERFGNDPVRFVEFFADDRNREEAVKLGLVKAPVVPPEPVTPAG